MADEEATEKLTVPSPPQTEIRVQDLEHIAVIDRTPTTVVHRVSTPTNSAVETLAVKQPAIHGTLSDEVIDQFQQEAEQWQALDDHANIVKVVDYGYDLLPWVHENAPLPWIAMEDMDGQNMNEYAGNLPIDQALWTAERIVDAVWHAHHNGIIHLDIKPANVLFREHAGEWNVPKVADWELSRAIVSHSNSIGITTPSYASPEQIQNQSTDQRSDQFQLGILLFELFTGQYPFVEDPQTIAVGSLVEELKNPNPDSVTSYSPTFPDVVDDIVAKTLAAKPEERYEATIELRDALAKVRSRLITDSNGPKSGNRSATNDTGHNTGHVSPRNAPKTPVQKRWTFPTRDIVKTSPCVISQTLFVGSDDGCLYAIDAETGTERWRYETGNKIRSSPIIADGTVYIGNDDGSFYAVDAATGNHHWIKETGSRIRTNPVVKNDSVFVATMDGLFALDVTTGDIQWEFESRFLSSPEITNDKIYFGENRDEKLYCLDITNGDKEWAFKIKSYNKAPPTVANGLVYIGGKDGILYSLDKDTGEPMWNFKTRGRIEQSPSVDKEYVYVGTSNSAHSLYSFNAHTGEKEWAFGESDDGIRASPVIAGDTVYANCMDFNIYALDRKTGEIKWTVEASGGDSSLTISDNRIYVGGNGSVVYTFE